MAQRQARARSGSTTLATYAYPKLGDLDVQGHRDGRRAGRAAADLEHEARDREPGAPADRGRAGLRHGHGRAHRRQPGPLAGPPRPPAAEAVEGAARSSTTPRSTGARRRPSWPSWPSREGIAAKALAFAILTAARSGEVRGMTWGEVDDAADGVWTVPAEPHQGRQGASGAADAAALALLGDARRARRAGVPEPDRPAPSRCPT